jgi:hypothetical protein
MTSQSHGTVSLSLLENLGLTMAEEEVASSVCLQSPTKDDDDDTATRPSAESLIVNPLKGSEPRGSDRSSSISSSSTDGGLYP